MSDWTSGYVAEIDYTYGYYSELNPLKSALALINAGVHPGKISTACELGFGQGVSVNIHAAATRVQWHGTDFNPAQAAFARELAAVSGSGAQLFDESFESFSQRSDLPEFDFICLHGIWSWISDENRQRIVDLIQNKLKVGGLLYISYNTLPGWASFVPVRNLMTQYANRMCSPATGMAAKVEETLAFVEKLLQANPKYLRANPLTTEKFNQVKGQNRHYLAHEYFNRDWHTTSFSAISEKLTEAKLTYACSAHPLDHVTALHMSPEQKAMLDAVPDLTVREDLRDLIVNQSFRRDYWVKGARRMKPVEQLAASRALQIVITTPVKDIALEANGALGKATLSATIYKPVLDFLADHHPRTIGELEAAVQAQGITTKQTIEVCMVLSGLGHMQLISPDAARPEVIAATAALNHHLLNLARAGDEVQWLACPLTGSALPCSRFEQIFTDAVLQGMNTKEQLAQHTWNVLLQLGQKIVKDGATLESEQENLAELAESAQAYMAGKLPMYKALGVIPR